MTCAQGANCTFSCPGGNCTFHCNGNGTCDTDCGNHDNCKGS
jgi:hypothetical protein